MQAFLTRKALNVLLLLVFLIPIIASLATLIVPVLSAPTFAQAATQTPVPPSAHNPGTQTIMFMGEEGIYTVNADGTGLKVLTNDGDHIVSGFAPARWSPDGRRIAFINSPPEHSPGDLYVMDRNGANRHFLASFVDATFGARISGLAWSPDGKTVALIKIGLPSGLFLVPTNGRHKPKLLVQGDSFYTVAWSPDGRKIAWKQFGNVGDANSGISAIDIVKADSSGNIQTLKQGNVSALDPVVWSGDGNRIYFDLNTFTPNANFTSTIYVAAADGSMDAQLTNPSLSARNPVLSPDGGRIAFSARNQIFVMNKDGSGVRQLTNKPGFDCERPSWSSDGRQIAFVCSEAVGEFTHVEGIHSCLDSCMYVISPDNLAANLVPLIQFPGGYPSFAPRP